MSDDKKNDAVSIDEHNKIVATANARAAEVDALKRQNEELKQKMAEAESVQKMKEEWKREQAEVKKELEEIKKNVDNTKVIKGVVRGLESNQQSADPTTLINKVLPLREKDPERFASNIRRWGYYKNATTAAYNREQLGMALSLHAGAQRTTRGLTAPASRPERGDIVLNQGKLQ